MVAASASHRRQRRHQRADHPGRRERRPHLAPEAADEQRQVQRLRHPGPPHPALHRELGGRGQEVLHVERGHDLDARPGHAFAAVRELVHAARGHHDRLARRRDDLPHPEPERHRPLEHVKALLLLGVDVRAGHAAVRGELELELEQLAGRVGGGLDERDALAAHGIVDRLSGESHWGEVLLRSLGSATRLRDAASRVVGPPDDLRSAPRTIRASPARTTRRHPCKLHKDGRICY